MAYLLPFVLAFLLAALYRPSYGLMMYIAIRLCIPHSARFLGLSLNTLVLALLILISLPVLFKRIREINNTQRFFIKNIFRYLIAILFLIITSSITAVVPFTFQISSFTQFVYTEILPSILFLLFFFNKKDFRKLNYILAICVIITTAYTIFTFISNTNPLYELLSTTTDEIQENAAMGRMDLLGTGVGIMNNKITTSLISLLYFVYFWNKGKVIGSWLNIIVLFLSFTAVVLTLQRSAIICLLLFFVYIVLCGGYKPKQLIIGASIISILLISFFSYFSQFGDFKVLFLSSLYFWDDSYQSSIGMGGSDMEMRIIQLKTTFELVDIHLLEGLGYNYSTYFDTVLNLSYSSIGEKMMGFESIIFKEITSTGLWGLFAFFLLLFRQFRLNVTGLLKEKRTYYMGFICSYLLAIIMTDHSGTTYLFFIFLGLNVIFKNLYMVEPNPTVKK